MNIVMTGGTSGLGRAALNHFLNQGYRVTVLARDPKKINVNNNNLTLIEADLNNIKSIKNAIEIIKNTHNHIDALLNNAGVWAFTFTESDDGIEETFQVNVLAPILLTRELLPLLKKAPSPKVITTSSGLHQGKIYFDDLEFRTSFSGFKAYRQSKLCEIVWTRYMSKKEPAVFWATQHPGVVNTELARTGGFLFKLFFRLFGKSPEKGAKTLIYLTEEDRKNLKSGEFYKNEKKAKTDTLASYDLRAAPKLIDVVDKWIEEKS